MAHGRPEEKMLRTVVWKEGSVSLLDQTRLPTKLVYIRCKKYKDIVNAIKNMVVRGAPAIGVSAAFGLALAASTSKAKNAKDSIVQYTMVSEMTTLPTGATNLILKIRSLSKTPSDPSFMSLVITLEEGPVWKMKDWKFEGLEASAITANSISKRSSGTQK